MNSSVYESFIRAKKGERLKGLKLRRIDAYCGGAALHKGVKESLVYCGSCTAVAIYIAAMAAVGELQ